jgi:sugar phosphate permease
MSSEPRDGEVEGPPSPAALPPPRPAEVERAGWRALSLLVVGYIGVYLCRKNLSVAVPLLQDEFHATKAQVGGIATAGTVAYFAGKFVNGPAVDWLGGRRGLLLSMVVVAVFGALGAFAPGLAVLSLLYGVNRFAGSASWGAMLKLVPTWFGPARTGRAVAALSLSYVAGSALATILAAQIAGAGGGWRAVMGLPSIVLVAVLVLCFLTVRPGPLGVASAQAGAAVAKPALGPVLLGLFSRPQFLVTLALSFTLTLMRETFNTWSVDFLRSIQTGAGSLTTAGLQSTGFDIAGGVSILVAGVAFDKVRPEHRRWLIASVLAVLSLVVAALPPVAAASTGGAAALVAVVGLLVYGPYSLLAGALAIESGGKDAAATAAGIIDGVGYVGGALAGAGLGKLLDVAGYTIGFQILAGVTLLSAVIALGLKPAPASASAPAPAAAGS